MRLRFDGNFGYDDLGYIRVHVVHYDSPVGWQAFLSPDGAELPGGPWATRAEAEAAAGAALAEVPPGPARRRTGA